MIFNLDKIKPNHVDEICKIITKHFCKFSLDDLDSREVSGLKENGCYTYHNGVDYRDDNYTVVLRSFDVNGNMTNQAKTPRPSKYLTFNYIGYENVGDSTFKSCSIWIHSDGRFTYSSDIYSSKLKETLSSIPFLIDFCEYMKTLDIYNK